MAYEGINGAFIANFGTANQTGVNLYTSTSFTPTGGSPTVLHKDTTTLGSFPALDSIWAFFGTQIVCQQLQEKGGMTSLIM